jgi:dihydroflavonol-4-reductase
VYNLATHISLKMGELRQCQTVNVHGVENVVAGCLRSGVKRLVHFSSIHAFEQRPLDIPVNESRPLVDNRYCPPYDRSKANGEKEVIKGVQQGLDAIIISPTGIIGPYDYKPSHFGEVLLSLAAGKMHALIDGGFNWVDVRDVVDGAMAAEKMAPKNEKYILSGHWASIRDLAEMVEQITGVPAPRLVCPLWLADIGAPVAEFLTRLAGKRPLYGKVSLMALKGNRSISSDKAARDLGYQPRPLRETLADTLKWFKEGGKY